MERSEIWHRGYEIGPSGRHDERVAGLGELGELQNMVAAPLAMGFGGACMVCNFRSQCNTKDRCRTALMPLGRLIPIASIITPATLSVGIDFPPPIFLNVPNVDFYSMNLAAPMAEYGTTGSGKGEEPGFAYFYAGPSLTVQRIADAVAAQGSILPVVAPAANSTWDLQFHGPSLHCSPVSSGFRSAVLDNILNYTFARLQGVRDGPDCGYGPGYTAWHPGKMNPNKSMMEYLPFTGTSNSSSGALNNDNPHGYPYTDMASIFLAIAPTLFSSTSAKDWSVAPTMCRGKPWYKAGLAEYHNTSTVLRCDVHNSTYHSTFSFVNGLQDVGFNSVTDVTDTPIVTVGEVDAYFNSSNQTDMALRPHACPPSLTWSPSDLSVGCLFDPLVLSTLSYQAVMHAFTDLLTGMISLGDEEDQQALITSTTQLSSTVLAEAPELTFCQSTQSHNQNAPPSIQQRAVTWDQQPFAGLLNTAAATDSTLPFQQALEQLFQNFTISLMSAPDLQYDLSCRFLFTFMGVPS